MKAKFTVEVLGQYHQTFRSFSVYDILYLDHIGGLGSKVEMYHVTLKDRTQFAVSKKDFIAIHKAWQELYPED